MINIFQPSVDKNSLQSLSEVFESNWLGRGPKVVSFESKLSNFFGVDNNNLHTLASATDAIFGVFKVLDFDKRKKEVIVPSISFPAVCSAILEAGMTPVIVDVDPLTGNVCLESVKKNLNVNTAAIFITHYGGIPVDVLALRSIVGDDVYILEDSACAFGTFIDGLACGTFGDFGCWSFDAMKMLVAGEGGACHFLNQDFAKRAKEYFYLGLPVSDKSGMDKSSGSSRWWEYQLECSGRRSMFTDINAAIALPQLPALKENFLKRELIRAEYCRVIEGNNKLDFSKQTHPNVQYSNYFYTVLTDDRDELASYLKANNVYSTFRYFPLHRIELFRDFNTPNLTGANLFSERALNIPIHHNLTDFNVEHISKLLQDY
jgi:aminotransferase|tara:strand:- start:2968 stop:4092 length:1125 start_codon:yes stop_codon:yes gene_type:complete